MCQIWSEVCRGAMVFAFVIWWRPAQKKTVTIQHDGCYVADKVRILWESKGLVTPPVLGTFRKTSHRRGFLRGELKDGLMFWQRKTTCANIHIFVLGTEGVWLCLCLAPAEEEWQERRPKRGCRQLGVRFLDFKEEDPGSTSQSRPDVNTFIHSLLKLGFNIMLNEISQTEKDKCCMISLIWGT